MTSFLREERQNTLIFTIVSHSPLFHNPLSNLRSGGISKCFLCPESLWLKFNCYIIFIMSSKSIHHTSNEKFSDFRQLSKQHHQVEICEASQFCIILELVAYILIFFKQTGICVTKTARNVHFGSMKL